MIITLLLLLIATAAIAQAPVPIPGTDIDRFNEGLTQFSTHRHRNPGFGVGSTGFHNSTRCESCHKSTEAGGCDEYVDNLLIARPGGTVTGEQLYRGGLFGFMDPPADIEAVSRRKCLPYQGTGLIDAIPDKVIVAMDNRDGTAHPDNPFTGKRTALFDPDRGIWRPGRFGSQSQWPSVLFQAKSAFANELGIEESEYATEAEVLAGGDTVGPTLGQVEDIAYFVSHTDRFPKGSTTPLTPHQQQGSDLFFKYECDGCHRPSYDVVFDGHPMTIEPYSDFLIHDLGIMDDDGVTAYHGFGIIGAGTSEWRTSPLWGISTVTWDRAAEGKRRFFHDRNTDMVCFTIIQRHGGEYANHRADMFANETFNDIEKICDFLRTL